MQDSGNNNPPKKPALNAGSDSLQLRYRLRHQLEQLDSCPISEEDFETKWEYLRQLARRVRQLGGMAFNPWPALICASATCMIFAALAYRQATREYSFVAPIDKFRILNRFDGYNYLFRKVHRDDTGKVTTSLVHAKFCQGYEPPLSAGETLTRLTYLDYGSCWYIESKGLGYDFEIDERGHDTLAPNCHEGQPINWCSPNLTEAVFPEEE